MQNCMIAQRRSLETETLQGIIKFDGLKDDDYLRVNIRFIKQLEIITVLLQVLPVS